ncbi:ribonuclease III [Thermotomaculum hydrothermale]|uniref:Ribonuclease 3 n=1 Tax=Thermotomaculum hydrothermale TaxID=981385 RepID=A0A7R6PZU9_9BACT|nr:ribonuclease III [Thermotomaculum hydrothermale]BBB32878.1 ribonuclease III [Thermotomaculum hydrothermale]
MANFSYKRIEKKISYSFQNKKLLKEAFTHASYAYLKNLKYNNERLEFLGDSVLGLIIGEYLFKNFPEQPEGVLTNAKAYMVHWETLSTITDFLEIPDFLLVADADRQIRNNPKIKENLFEALVGAIYLDSDLQTAKQWVLDIYEKTGFLVREPEKVIFDYKSKLQEILQGEGLGLPEYNIIATRGPVHDTSFIAEVKIKGKVVATGEGKSKKIAHQNCAKKVLKKLENKDLNELLDED